MTKAQGFLSGCIGFLFGVGVGSVYHIPTWEWWLLCAICVATSTLCCVARARVFVMMALVCMLGFCFGGVRISLVLAHESALAVFVGTKQDFEGVVMTDPDVRQTSQMLTVQPDGFSERVLVTTTLASTFMYGDRVWVRGKISEPEPFNGFDYPGFLARAQIYTVMKYPKVITLRTGEGLWGMRLLLRVKHWVVDTIHERMPGENGDVLLGMLIGHKRGLPAEALEDFVRTGTSHMLAVSGFNVSIFIIWLSGLAAWIGRRRQLVVSALAVVMFAGISGFSAAVVRASCMGILMLVSFGQGRLYVPAAAVVMAAAGMVFQNPRLLYWDVGFQLSVVATLGIVWGMDSVAVWVERFPRVSVLLRLAGVTACALLATIPVSLLHFGQLSTVAIVVNMIILPFVEVIMALGLLSLLPGIGVGFAYVCAHALALMRWIVALFASIPFASVSLALSGTLACVGLIFVLSVLYVASEDGAWLRLHMTTLRRMWYNLPRLAERAAKKYQ